MAASASMPPTPQPSTERPFTIVVCESVPTSVSGYASSVATDLSGKVTLAFAVHTVCDRYSRLTWWQMPVPGGTTRKSSNERCEQQKKTKKKKTKKKTKKK